MTTVHASPEYQLNVQHPPPAGYPQEVVADSFSRQPDDLEFADRKLQYLAHCRLNPAPLNTKGVYYELARLAAGGRPHQGIFHAALDFIEQRRDCADFVLHGILRLLYQFADHPWISQDLLERARDTVLEFKYWPDEPGIDSMCTWTENHQILFASAAYLAGQLYPEANFGNSGHSGREKMAINRPRIQRWLDLRFRTGFSEWLSHVYYDEDVAALLSLINFSLEAEIRRRAAMVLDLLLLDIALNSFQGVFGSTHGRSYENSKKWASQEGTSATQKLLFGIGQYSMFDNMSAACLALSPNYRPPPVLAAIAADLERQVMENRQRMGIRLDEAERWGLGLQEFEDGMVLLSLEAYAHPRNAALVMRMMDAFNWWENDFLAPFGRYRRLLDWLRRARLLAPVVRLFQWDLGRNTREEVNLYTYRTPDYLLSCAQDYRPGYGGDQQHIWQATLGPNAVCFTTHPGKLSGPSPSYWAGSGQLPRAAQVGNVLFAIYNLHRKLALYVPTRLLFTHAWLPHDQFDEFIEQAGWIFARKDEGYLALRSQQPYRWQIQPGEDQQRELIADGRRNIWICELGRRADDGPFAQFVERISQAELHFAGLNVTYRSPSQGKLTFGWRQPLRQNGRAISLHDYPRYQNPYTQSEFPAGKIEVRRGNQWLRLDWEKGERQVNPAGSQL
jgi:hypothetical protein